MSDFAFHNCCTSQQAIMSSRRVWTEDEDRVIQELVRKYGNKNWAHIANKLTQQLGTPQRSGKQCRERWHNHLNPGIEKKVWSKKEEENMFNLHKIYGNRWTVIADFLPGRTDNSIKNYFYSTIRRSLRRMGKFVGSKNSTQQMKHIKPSTLSKIFQAGSESCEEEDLPKKQKELFGLIKENCETVRDSIIKFTNYKPTRNDRASEQERNQFEEVISKMILINNAYERIKVEEKRRRNDEMVFQKDNGKLMMSQDSYEEDSLSEEEPPKETGSSQSKKQRVGPKIKDNKLSIKLEYTESPKKIKVQEKESEVVKNENCLTTADLKLIENNLNYTVPTVIIKSQHYLSGIENQILQDGNLLNQMQENPEFFIELKDQQIPSPLIKKKSNFSLQSPGFFFHTPSNNPFSYVQTPSTPKSTENRLFELVVSLQNSNIDESQSNIQKQIEANMKCEKRLDTSVSTIGGSPGSAFSFCGLP